GTLQQVTATNDVGSRKQAYLNFNATGGASYRIAVASASSNSLGSLRLVVAPGGQLDTNPPSIFISSPLNGQWVSNFLVTVSGAASATTTNATKEFNEPYHAGNEGGKSVWWTWQAPADGALFLSTSNSAFDTLLGLYTGARVANLATIASNDDADEGVSFSQI